MFKLKWRKKGNRDNSEEGDEIITSAAPPRKSDKSKGTKSASSSPMMLGPHFKVGKKIGSGNFGELRLG